LFRSPFERILLNWAFHLGISGTNDAEFHERVVIGLKIICDEETGDVIIDGLRVPGFIADEHCPSWTHFLIYHEDYDSCPLM
jgi:hypothetical protein